jgi:DNA-binding transcriptional LysR family regulator
MIVWDDARFFLAVHRARSLSAAGRALGVNQSTVGRRVAALEEALGARLFFQTPDGYVLAPAGERMLARAERMEDEALAIARELSGDEGKLTGTVRVTAPDAFGARVITPLLAEFVRRYPEIELELVADNRALSLSKREADLAVRVGKPSEPSLIVRRLAAFAQAIYASKRYVAERGKPRGLDFDGHDFVDLEPPSAREAVWVAQHARRARVVFTSNATLSQLAAVQEGLGLGVLPCYLGDTDPNLVRVCPPIAAVSRELWLVLHRDLQHAARIRACAEFLVEALSARAAELNGRARLRNRVRAPI